MATKKSKSTYKRLTRSTNNQIVAGVLSGVAKYFNLDPTIVRLVFVILALITWVVPMVLLYVIAMFIVPAENKKAN